MLKRLCEWQIENGLLTAETAVDIFQLAMLCDAPRLSLICHRFILKNFKAVSATEGWKVMKDSHPVLEKEILVSMIGEDSVCISLYFLHFLLSFYTKYEFVSCIQFLKKHSLIRKVHHFLLQRRKEIMRKAAERQMYQQLYEAMEAVVHIFRDGCRTIGPHDKMLKKEQSPCHYVACKGVEALVRHFAGCKKRVPGGCIHCKRMWQILELHSRLCANSDVCRVPLCR